MWLRGVGCLYCNLLCSSLVSSIVPFFGQPQSHDWCDRASQSGSHCDVPASGKGAQPVIWVIMIVHHCLCTHMSMFICVCVCMYLCVCVCLCACLYVCVSVCVCGCVCMHLCVHAILLCIIQYSIVFSRAWRILCVPHYTQLCVKYFTIQRSPLISAVICIYCV